MPLRNFLITFASIVVIAAAGYGIFQTAWQRSEEFPVPIDTSPQQRGILAFDHQKEISFTSLREEAFPSENGVTMFTLDVPFLRALSTLSPSMPGEYLRALDEDSFFGSVKGSAEGNFFILGHDSYQTVAASQLEWEKTMGSDLLPLFGPASSTVARFEDRIVANRDARVALDAKGRTLFVQGLFRSDTIIFARNEDVFRLVYDMLLRREL